MNQAGIEELLRYLVLCKQLAPYESKLSAMLAGKELPEHPATVRALAEWCCKYSRLNVAAVGLYDVLFSQQTALADDLEAKHRFHAACAAALAGCGSGTDAAKLDSGAKAALRIKALEWLRADLDAWAQRYKNAKDGEPWPAARAARQWQLCKELAGVRDTASLAKLPEKERQAWQNLWADVNALASRDPLLLKSCRTGGRRSFEGHETPLPA
jgi:hypothetical protein